MDVRGQIIPAARYRDDDPRPINSISCSLSPFDHVTRVEARTRRGLQFFLRETSSQLLANRALTLIVIVKLERLRRGKSSVRQLLPEFLNRLIAIFRPVFGCAPQNSQYIRRPRLSAYRLREILDLV